MIIAAALAIALVAVLAYRAGLRQGILLGLEQAADRMIEAVHDQRRELREAKAEIETRTRAIRRARAAIEADEGFHTDQLRAAREGRQ